MRRRMQKRPASMCRGASSGCRAAGGSGRKTGNEARSESSRSPAQSSRSAATLMLPPCSKGSRSASSGRSESVVAFGRAKQFATRLLQVSPELMQPSCGGRPAGSRAQPRLGFHPDARCDVDGLRAEEADVAAGIRKVRGDLEVETNHEKFELQAAAGPQKHRRLGERALVLVSTHLDGKRHPRVEEERKVEGNAWTDVDAGHRVGGTGRAQVELAFQVDGEPVERVPA